MPKYWKDPYYDLITRSGKKITIDVTTSVSAGLSPSSLVTKSVIPFLKKKQVVKVLDFGAGALRHTIPLLNSGFQVCAVEFQEGFSRPVASRELAKAQKHGNFSKLIWPNQFISDKRKFDAALLIYVLQIMPIQKEREAVLKHIYQKLKPDSYLFYSSQYGQITQADKSNKVSDGYFRWPKRKMHSFYTEFNAEDTDKLIESMGFKRLKSLGRGGPEQFFVYVKGSSTWV